MRLREVAETLLSELATDKKCPDRVHLKANDLHRALASDDKLSRMVY